MKHCQVTLSSFADKAVFAGMYLGNVLSTVQQEKVMITKQKRFPCQVQLFILGIFRRELQSIGNATRCWKPNLVKFEIT